MGKKQKRHSTHQFYLRLHSSTILAFRQNLLAWAKEILVKEMGIKVGRKNFILNNYVFGWNLVIFEHPNKLGYYRDDGREIGINKNLMSLAKTSVIKNVLRHEIMHMMVSVHLFLEEKKRGYRTESDDSPHGEIFRLICAHYHYNIPEIMSAKANLVVENNKLEGDLKSEKVIEKVKKLLSLAQSANKNEAELATQKANELLLKHNLELLGESNDETLYVKVIYTAGRMNAKMQTIYRILKTFLVHPVYNRTRGGTYLEIIGTKTNIELAEYIAEFLDRKLDQLCEQYCQKCIKTSLSDRNSFILGIGVGYEEKVLQHRQNIFAENECMALIKIEKNLSQQAALFYSGLSSFTTSHCHFNPFAHAAGIIQGKGLSINPALNPRGSKNTGQGDLRALIS